MLISLFVGTVFVFLQIVEKMQNIRVSTYKLKQLKAQAEQLDASPAVKSAIQDDVNKIVEKRLRKSTNGFLVRTKRRRSHAPMSCAAQWKRNWHGSAIIYLTPQTH